MKTAINIILFKTMLLIQFSDNATFLLKHKINLLKYFKKRVVSGKKHLVSSISFNKLVVLSHYIVLSFILQCNNQYEVVGKLRKIYVQLPAYSIFHGKGFRYPFSKFCNFCIVKIYECCKKHLFQTKSTFTFTKIYNNSLK